MKPSDLTPDELYWSSLAGRRLATVVSRLDQIMSDFIVDDRRVGDNPSVRVVLWLFSSRLSTLDDNSTPRIIFSDVQHPPKQWLDCRWSAVQGRQPTTIVDIWGPGNSIGSLAYQTTTTSHVRMSRGLYPLLQHVCYPDPPRAEPRVWVSRCMNAARISQGLSQSQVASRVGTSRIAVSRWEAGSQLPSFGPLMRWSSALGLMQDSGRSIAVPVDVTPQLLPYLKQDPNLLHSLTPEQFEDFIAERLSRMGFSIQKTGGTFRRDGGIDLIAMPSRCSVASFLMAVQAKHSAKHAKVGRAAIDRLLSWKDSVFRLGLLVTNTGFTKDALWTAALDRNTGFLRLRDFEDMKKWIEGNLWSPTEWREIPQFIELAPGITVPVPRIDLQSGTGVAPARIRGTVDDY
jgi:transcriptional regulator with XRE-family HTH domain